MLTDSYCKYDWEFDLVKGEYARLAFTWMNNGDWILAHGTEYPEFPLGSVYWYGIYAPSHQISTEDDYVTVSHKQDNNDVKKDPWVVTDFVADENGTYKVTICRSISDYSKDTNVTTNIGVAVTVRDKPIMAKDILVPIISYLLN